MLDVMVVGRWGVIVGEVATAAEGFMSKKTTLVITSRPRRNRTHILPFTRYGRVLGTFDWKYSLEPNMTSQHLVFESSFWRLLFFCPFFLPIFVRRKASDLFYMC